MASLSILALFTLFIAGISSQPLVFTSCAYYNCSTPALVLSPDNGKVTVITQTTQTYWGEASYFAVIPIANAAITVTFTKFSIGP